MRQTWIASICGVIGLSMQASLPAAPPVLGTLSPTAVVGDANGDGFANFKDFQVLSLNLGKSGGLAQGDFDGNGQINSLDFDVFSKNAGGRRVDAYFGKIADSATAVPSGTGAFALLNAPMIDSTQTIAFLGSGASNYGIYRYSAGAMARIADNATAIPSGTGTFVNFGQPSLDGGGKIAFQAVGNNQEGIYQFASNTLTKVVNKSTAKPDGGAFSTFGDPGMINSSMAFVATGSSDTGAYAVSGANVISVANTSMSIPGGTGAFSTFDNAVGDQTSTWFIGRGINQAGIYKRSGGTVTALLDKKTAIPGTAAKFSSIGNLSMDSGNLSFSGVFGNLSGMFRLAGNQVTRLADSQTFVPGGGGARFASFGISSIGGGNVAFTATDTQGRAGLFAWIEGELVRIIDSGITLGGKRIDAIDISRDAVTGNRVVFQARFTDNSYGLFNALLAPAAVPGDLTADGKVTSADFAVLQKNMGRGGDRGSGDFNGDGKVTFADYQYLERNYNRIGSTGLIGDIDLDGKVDNNDLSILNAHYGKPGGWLQGDFNRDGVVGFGDYQLLQLNWLKTGALTPFDLPLSGRTGPGLRADEPSVPEPASALAWAAAAALLLHRRRRSAA